MLVKQRNFYVNCRLICQLWIHLFVVSELWGDPDNYLFCYWRHQGEQRLWVLLFVCLQISFAFKAYLVFNCDMFSFPFQSSNRHQTRHCLEQRKTRCCRFVCHQLLQKVSVVVNWFDFSFVLDLCIIYPFEFVFRLRDVIITSNVTVARTIAHMWLVNMSWMLLITSKLTPFQCAAMPVMMDNGEQHGALEWRPVAAAEVRSLVCFVFSVLYCVR